MSENNEYYEIIKGNTRKIKKYKCIDPVASHRENKKINYKSLHITKGLLEPPYNKVKISLTF